MVAIKKLLYFDQMVSQVACKKILICSLMYLGVDIREEITLPLLESWDIVYHKIVEIERYNQSSMFKHAYSFFNEIMDLLLERKLMMLILHWSSNTMS